MDFTVAETMPKSTTKDGQVNFHIHEDVDAPEKIQHNEEKERCIFFLITSLTNYHLLGLK